jgi:pyruvate,water dikinase
MTRQTQSQYIRHFNELGMADVDSVGGKNASLGELYRELAAAGVRVPDGFAITVTAFRALLDQANAGPRLAAALEGLDANDVDDLARRAAVARQIITRAALPDALALAIIDAYHHLQQRHGANLTVAVRSSATAEDLPTASFAGQHDTYLNISGEADLLDAVQRCFASLYTDRAIRYRLDQGYPHENVMLSVGVMKMVRSDLAASGVAFTLDTETGFRDVVFITGAYGLGENVVQGMVDPDEFYVFKPTLQQGYRRVLRRQRGAKAIRMVYQREATGVSTRNLPTPLEDRDRFCISDDDVLQLADMALTIENHYSSKAGHPMPMDIEWAKDGLDGQLYIVQARPETVASQQPPNLLQTCHLDAISTCRVSGHAVGQRAAAGLARVITDAADLNQFQPGEILVAESTSPDWGTVMKTAAAIITDRGGRTCHAAIVARELGIPAVVGCGNATRTYHTGEALTVSCAEGDIGRVYDGILPISHQSIDLGTLTRPKTRMMLNIGQPETAFRARALPNDGVGLARMEFIISQHIGAHPMALLHPERVEDEAEREQLALLTRQHLSPAEYFIERLSEGVGTIAAAFYPKPVIVRMSDFKTNEYAGLLGGRWFEPQEENPMLGFRGASRYTHPAYREGFALECRAMKRVRETLGLSNVKLMIPFCRRVDEARQVLAAMAALGLVRGDNGLEIYVMCEIPNNVVQIDAFAELFDGFSIGSNDLTQLVLGVDRDSTLVAFEFDERDPGVKAMIQQTIDGGHRHGRHVGICGQAPSDYPDMAEFLVESGIDSLSLTPDALLATTRHVLAIEAWLGLSRDGTPPVATPAAGTAPS